MIDRIIITIIKQQLKSQLMRKHELPVEAGVDSVQAEKVQEIAFNELKRKLNLFFT